MRRWTPKEIPNVVPVVIPPELIIEERTLTSDEVTNKSLTLKYTPIGSKVAMDLVGGVPQRSGFDFSVSGKVVSWNLYALETILTEAGKDTLRLMYLKEGSL